MDILRRLLHIARSSIYSERWEVEESPYLGGRRWPGNSSRAAGDGEGDHATHANRSPATPEADAVLAGHYANLEVPFGSELETVRAAWRRMMKKYHPDLHCRDPERRRIANELTARLTQAYRHIEEAADKS